jgi:hypothetical protein
MIRAVIAALALALACGCTYSPERRAAAGEWVGPPVDADGVPIPKPVYKPAPYYHAR